MPKKPYLNLTAMTKKEMAPAFLSRGISGTRTLKNLRYLQKVAPQIIPTIEPKEGFQRLIPFETLRNLHTPAGQEQVQTNPSLTSLLKGVRLPYVGNKVAGPLFKGKFHFVKVQFIIQDQGNKAISISDIDMATIVQYAILAAYPISVYASQYGKCSVQVSPTVIPYSVLLPTANYTDADLQRWVDDIASEPDNRISVGDCVVILSPDGVVNSNMPSDCTGYHSKASVPYIYSRVYGQNLTMADKEFLYAQMLSHEMAEVVADPLAIGENPEICDACAGNCDNLWLSYFDDRRNYIATSKGIKDPGFEYRFYINAVVLPEYANGSTMRPPVAMEKACNYPCPKTQPLDPICIEHQQTAAWLVELWLMIHGGDPVGSEIRRGSADLLSTTRAITALARCLEDEKAFNAITEALVPLTRQACL